MERNFLLRITIATNFITLASVYVFIYSGNSNVPEHSPINNSKSFTLTEDELLKLIRTNIKMENQALQQQQQNFSKEISSEAEKHRKYYKEIPNKKFCFNVEPKTQFEQKGKYWVLYNYIIAEKRFGCDESITYTTHGDFTFLDNLIPLLERWQGSISLALYSPGTDFIETIRRILYLGECYPIVRKFVTFHIIFDNEHTPNLSVFEELLSEKINCDIPPSFGDDLPTYKKENGLFYPINVARNVARQQATTHFVLASDIELYPNPNLIQDFLQMIKEGENTENDFTNKVYILPVFEVEANATVPNNKKELVQMLLKNIAIPFHKYVCPTCHKIPSYNEWIRFNDQPGLNVFKTVKREGEFQHWEPFYIGTKSEPLWDERLTWEGQSNKMTQAYLLCLLDYELRVLDKGFLVHRPGIKRSRPLKPLSDIVRHQNTIIQKTIFSELKYLYGEKLECHMIPIYKNSLL